MADLDFSVNANTSSAERNLRRLEDTVGVLQSTLGGLKNAIAGLAIGNFITQTIALGTQLNNLSAATGISADAIRGFQLAVRNSGGDSAQAADAISELNLKIGEAAAGSGDLQKAFNEVGVGLNELATLSSQDILSQVVSGLANIQDKSARSAIAMKIFGEAVKTVDFGNVNAGLVGFTAQSAGIGSASASAAKAQQNMANVLDDLRTKLLIALDPVTKLAAGILENTKAITTFIEYAVKLGIVLLTFTALGRIGGALVTMFTALRTAFAAVMSLIVPAGNQLYTWANIWRMFLNLPIIEKLKLIPLVFIEVGKWIATQIPLIGSLAVGWGLFTDNVGAAIDKLKEYLGLKGVTPGGEQAEVRRVDNAIEAQASKDATALREVQAAFQKQADSIRLVTSEFKTQNNEIIDNINFEKQLIGKSEDFIAVERAREAILKKAADETYKLRQAKAALGKDEQGLAAVYDQQIAAISKAGQVDADRVANATAGLQGLILLEQTRNKEIENSIAAFESRNNREIALGERLLDLNERLADVKFEGSLAGMNPLQRQIAQIREDNRKGAVEAGRSFAAQFDGMELTTEQSKELSDGLGKIAAKYKDIADVQIDNLNASRTWGAGWKDAFDDYVDNATNAANTARDLFKKMTDTIEDSLVSMAKTGKFEWKSMLASMAEDLLRSQIRQLLASLMGGKSTGGSAILGAISGVGKLLGFANGGVIPTNGPVVVGERGPELLTGAAGRTVIPNHQLGGSNVTYNINAVDALSFKQMIARDPGFIHAVATQGGKSIPQTRR